MSDEMQADPAVLEAIERFARAGIAVMRAQEPWLNLYYAQGFPELTRNQLISASRQLGQ